MGSIMITNYLMEKYGVTPEELHVLAMENMERLSPSVCEPLENVMVEVSASQLSEQEGISFEEAKEHVREMLPPGGTEIYCLSNESKLNGAVSIISENVQKMVAEQVGGDYYVLPSSVHELMIVPKSLGMNLGELEEMVSSVNAACVRDASLLLDIEFYDHVIVAGETGKTFSIRENVPELFEPSHYAHLISHVADGVKEEVSYYGTSPVTYEILQIKDGSNGEQYRFWGMNYVQETGLQVNVSDYESKYQGKLKPGETLDTLYERFNIHRPEDFTGHSLSVSDVIVLESGGDKKAFYVDSFGFCEVKDFFAEKLERSEITFTVAECGEFHQMGRYRDDIENADEAIAVWKEFKEGALNGIPSIGILAHVPGQTEMDDEQVDILSGNWIDLDMIRYYPTIRNEKVVIEMIADLMERIRDIKVVGKMPQELLLRELDPKKEILSEDERSLIQEYAMQMKDMSKTRELAERICYQEEYGNQDVAPAVIAAKKEIEEEQEKKEEHLHQKKR